MPEKVILLVEDNRDDQQLLLRALKRCNTNAEIVISSDGLDVMEWLLCEGPHADRARRRLPNLILLDLKLPIIPGLEVLRRIRADARTMSVPVVILTSSNEDQDVLDGYRIGANSYLRKPVNFNQFVGAVKQLTDYWLALNELPDRAL